MAMEKELVNVRLRCSAWLVFLHFAWSAVTWAQRSTGVFGVLDERALDYTASSVTVSVTYPGGPGIAVLAASRPTLIIYQYSPDGLIAAVDSCELPHRHKSVLAADLDGDGREEFVTLGGDWPEFSVIKLTRTGLQVTTYPAEKAQRMLIADVNNDHRPDILLFGRGTAGIVTYLNRKGGAFQRAADMVPEVSVSDLAVMDLNGDAIPDLFVLNWLSNRLDIYYGITSGVFSDPIDVPLGGEPSDLSVAKGPHKGSLRIAVTLPVENEVAIVDGDALGEFSVTKRLPFPGSPSDVVFRDVDGDGRPDLVVSTLRGIVVNRAGARSGFSAGEFYGTFPAGSAWCLGDVWKKGRLSLVGVQPSGRRLFVARNEGDSVFVRLQMTYAVGSSPRGVSFVESGDSSCDLAVANEGSSGISILAGTPNGTILPQTTISTNEGPRTIRSISRESRSTIVVAHASPPGISALSFSGESESPKSYWIPSWSSPLLLDIAENAGGHNQLAIVVRYLPSFHSGVRVSLFEQLSGRQFLERTIRPSIQDQITAAAVHSVEESGEFDLLFTAPRANGDTSIVYSSTAPSSLRFGVVHPVCSYPDSNHSTAEIVWGRTPVGPMPRAVLRRRSPESDFGILQFVRADSAVLSWPAMLKSRERVSILYLDVDQDGVDDLILHDLRGNTIEWYRGLTDGTFSGPILLFDDPDIGGIAVGSLRRDGTIDLALTRPSRGGVTVLKDPFRSRGQH
jgi:hypothetical protein